MKYIIIGVLAVVFAVIFIVATNRASAKKSAADHKLIKEEIGKLIDQGATLWRDE